jgi:Anti-sigma-K factor rskA/Putative zinc-finger
VSPSGRHGLDCERGADAAAYVLGALEEQEAQRFREHLSECPLCREEVAQLQAVVDSLALGVARAAAPQGLRARVMAIVHAEAELLSAAGEEADHVAAPPRRRWSRQLVPGLATALALGVGLLIGALAINTGASQRTEVIRAVVETPGHRATAELRKVGSHLELLVVGLPAPPPGRIYEVWLEHGAQAPEPTDALFSVTKTGNGSVGVPGNLQGVSKVLVTDEPLGGSLKPTRKPVIIAPV